VAQPENKSDGTRQKESIVRFRTSSEFWMTAKDDWIGIVLQTVEQRGLRWNEEGNEEMSQ
jgi:hypothetical protein